MSTFLKGKASIGNKYHFGLNCIIPEHLIISVPAKIFCQIYGVKTHMPKGVTLKSVNK